MENTRLSKIPAIQGAFNMVKLEPSKNEVKKDSFSTMSLKKSFSLSGVLNKRESSFHASIHCHKPSAISGIPRRSLSATLLNIETAALMKKVNRNPIKKYISKTPTENPNIVETNVFRDFLEIIEVPNTPVIKMIHGDNPDNNPVTNANQNRNSR
jgi:hypothetical protein